MVMETKLSIDHASEIANMILFYDKIIISAVNYAGGDRGTVEQHPHHLDPQVSNQGIHVVVTRNHVAAPLMLSHV